MNFRLTEVARAAAIATAAVAVFGTANAASLLTGLGGESGFGQIALAPNDDRSSTRLDLPFAINFFGTTYNTFFANNNGNITFSAPLTEFTPAAFPIANQPLIAPWWADVDTRSRTGLASATQNNVYVASPNASTAVITWHDVGYFSNSNDKLNNFQLVLRDRSETGAGNFDFDFRYQQLQWTTGNASDGVNGLGGTPAQAGYDNGLGTNFYTLPGSRTGSVLDLVNTSNVSEATPGLWSFAVRNGETPGFSPTNPLLPVVVDGSYVFNFNVVIPTTRLYLDPLVAVGYEYQSTGVNSPSFQSVLLPSVGDNNFTLDLWDGTAYAFAENLTAGQVYNFATGGVRRFRIGGIEVDAALDPANTSAFVTGVTFTNAGQFVGSQTPITFDTGVAAVPEPSTYALTLLGMAFVVGSSLRRRRKEG
jgi:hypothetical protein